MSRAKNDNPPVLFDDGLQSRDFVSVRDLVEACRLAIRRPDADYHAVNTDSGKPTTILHVAEVILKCMGKGLSPKVTQTFRKGDVRHCYPDLTKAHTLLGFEPRVGFEDGMKDLIAWAETAEAKDAFDPAHREMVKRGLV